MAFRGGDDDLMMPFFCYYGGKWRAGRYYPPPEYPVIIEPFAGSAGYSVRHYSRNVRLYDLDMRICCIWDYLIKVSPSEILALPIDVEDVSGLNVCQEAKYLIGFWLCKGRQAPGLRPTTFMKSGMFPDSQWGSFIKERIANQVKKIRHWKIYNQSYDSIGIEEATWFVDPPYQGKPGRIYKHNKIDYDHLSRWCKSIPGQSIVCEQSGADWLPFQDFLKVKTIRGFSHEVLWEGGRKGLMQTRLFE